MLTALNNATQTKKTSICMKVLPILVRGTMHDPGQLARRVCGAQMP
jgi:hypothetical protein